MHESYDRVEVANATYLKGLCGGSGPPNWTYYPFNGIYISVSLYGGVQIGLHYPVGATGHLDTDTIEIRGSRGGKPVNLIADLHPADHWAGGHVAPQSFNASIDPINPKSCCATTGNGFIWASYRATIGIPEDLERGILVIPAITVDGRHYGPQELSIVHRAYTGIYPINC